MDNKKLSNDIFHALGGARNIIEAHNCMTRLRVTLREELPEHLTAIKKIDGVLGINQSGDELQIILGPGTATTVTNEVNAILKASSHDNKIKIGDGTELHDKIRKKNATPFKLFLKKISSIFVPLIPGFIACGLITGILNIILKADPSLASMGVIKLLAVMGNAIFFGMNIFVGINTAKVFGGSPTLGGVLAVILTHPGLSGIEIFGSELMPGRGGVIAVLLVAAFGAEIEKRLHKAIPEMFDLFLTPLLVILIAGFAAIAILQPIGYNIANAIGTFANQAIVNGGAVVGFILAGTFLPMVMVGIHQALTPIHAQLLESTGVTILLPVLAMAGAGQVGAAFAVYFKTKNSFLKKTVANALPVGIMGIGEPLIYGVTLPLFKPFIGACIGAAFGGAIQAYFVVGAAGMGISGLPLAAITNNIPAYLLGIVVAYACGFIATWIIGFDDPVEE